MYPFYYSLLEKKNKRIYQIVFEAICDGTSTISVDLSEVSDNDIETVIIYIINDHPEIGFPNKMEFKYSTRSLTLMSPFYYWPNNPEIKKFIAEFKNMAKKSCVCEYDRVKFVHDYIIDNVKFDHNEIQDYRHDINNHTAIGALYTGKSVCEGIARFAQFLLHIVDVKAIYCPGFAVDFYGENNENESNGHAWTVVSINNRYYHLDVSHDLCLTVKEDQKEYSYFNLTTEEIGCDHIIDSNYKKSFDELNCVSSLHNYFYYNKRFFSTWDDLKCFFYNTFDLAIQNERESSFVQFKLAKELCAQEDLSFEKICIGIINKTLDKYVALFPDMKFGYDSPSYILSQNTFSINFRFYHNKSI